LEFFGEFFGEFVGELIGGGAGDFAGRFAHLAAGLTLLLGLGYFIFPLRTLSHLKLEGVERHFEAYGEGRSSFAGFLIAVGALVLMMPGAIAVLLLGACWLTAFVGKLLHVLIDGSRRLSVIIRLLIALCLAGFLLIGIEIPDFNLVIPVILTDLLPFISAIITVLFGLMCFLFPTTSLHLMRLRPKDTHPAARGEARGTLAGFYLGIGGAVLLIGGFVPTLMLGLAWMMTAFGRIIAMLSDKSNNGFNWLSLLLELVLAGLPLSVLLGLFG